MGRLQDQTQTLPGVVDMCIASTTIAEKWKTITMSTREAYWCMQKRAVALEVPPCIPHPKAGCLWIL